ncbi:MAG TPA: hypothetical protein VF921_17765 [Vicinamibacterales bacterium]
MKRKLGLTAALVVALALTGYAQKKPDFSGAWAPDQAATDAANASTTTAAPPAGGGGGGGGMGGRGGGGPMTIKQTADSLAIERQGRNGATTTTYKLDGTETEVQMRGGTAKAKAKWDGDKIVIETTGAGQDGTPVTTTATYSIDKDGVLWIENKTAMGSRKTAYKKST